MREGSQPAASVWQRPGSTGSEPLRNEGMLVSCVKLARMATTPGPDPPCVICVRRQYLPRAWAPKATASTQTDRGDLEAAQLLLEGLQLDSSQQQEQESHKGHGAAAQQPPALEARKSYSTNPFAVSGCCVLHKHIVHAASPARAPGSGACRTRCHHQQLAWISPLACCSQLASVTADCCCLACSV